VSGRLLIFRISTEAMLLHGHCICKLTRCKLTSSRLDCSTVCLVRYLYSPQAEYSASWQSTNWCIHELSSFELRYLQKSVLSYRAFRSLHKGLASYQLDSVTNNNLLLFTAEIW